MNGIKTDFIMAVFVLKNTQTEHCKNNKTEKFQSKSEQVCYNQSNKGCI